MYLVFFTVSKRFSEVTKRSPETRESLEKTIVLAVIVSRGLKHFLNSQRKSFLKGEATFFGAFVLYLENASATGSDIHTFGDVLGAARSALCPVEAGTDRQYLIQKASVYRTNFGVACFVRLLVKYVQTRSWHAVPCDQQWPRSWAGLTAMCLWSHHPFSVVLNSRTSEVAVLVKFGALFVALSAPKTERKVEISQDPLGVATISSSKDIWNFLTYTFETLVQFHESSVLSLVFSRYFMFFWGF